MKDCKTKSGKPMPKGFKAKMKALKEKINGKPIGSKKMKDKK